MRRNLIPLRWLLHIFYFAARSKTISVHWHQGTAETRFHNTATSIRRTATAAAAKQTNAPLAQRQSLDRMSRLDSIRSASNGALRAPPPTATTIELTNGALVSSSCRVQNALLRWPIERDKLRTGEGVTEFN